MPPPVPHSILDFLSAEESKRIHATPLPRSYSNWTRLCLILLFTVHHSGSSKGQFPCHQKIKSFSPSLLGLSFFNPAASSYLGLSYLSLLEGLWVCGALPHPVCGLAWVTNRVRMPGT